MPETITLAPAQPAAASCSIPLQFGPPLEGPFHLTRAEADAHCIKPPPYRPTLRLITDAIVSPLTRKTGPTKEKRGEHDGGVFYADGRPCLEGINLSPGRTHFQRLPDPPMEPRRLAGRWLFAGYTKIHFGQFLTECLTRLWALDEPDVGPVEGLIFIDFRPTTDAAQRQSGADAFSRIGFVQEILHAITGGRRIVVVGGQLEVEQLIVPGALPTHKVLGGDRHFRRMCGRMAALAESGISDADQCSRRIYVSRSKLPASLAQFMLENVIESNLILNRYRIFHPQDHSVREQLAAFRRADHIVLAEGSAGHLLAMVSRPDQKVGIIARRPNYHRFTLQLRAFGTTDSFTISALSGRVLPLEGAALSAHSAMAAAPAVLDFNRLRDGLAAVGLVEPAKWRVPTSDELEAAVDAYQKARDEWADQRRKPRVNYTVHPVEL